MASDDILSLRDRAARLVDYLRQVYDLRNEPVRDFRRYNDAAWDVAKLPVHEAVTVGTGTDQPWLRVRKTSPPPSPPAPPEALRPLLSSNDFTDPSRPPTLSDAATSTFALLEKLAMAAQLQAWVDGAWESWARRARPILGARALYQQLYELRLRLQREEALIELVWGHGILGWLVQGQTVLYPIAAHRLSLEFDLDSGDITLAPDGGDLEIDLLAGLDVKGFDALLDLRRGFHDNPLAPGEQGTRDLYTRVANALGLDGKVEDNAGVPVPGPAPCIATSSVIFVRRRSTLYPRFFEKLREEVTTGDLRPPLAAILAHEPSKLEADVSEWHSIGEDVLLPLESNSEQGDIIARLAKHRGVTVQGPPGTGKTHTIANLVSHLVAHGKRVLVTSFKEQPLSVLREKIPENIRNLSVSVLGDSSGSLAQLDQAVQAIYSQAVGVDRDVRRREVEHLQEALDASRRQLAKLRHDVWAAVRREKQRVAVGDHEYSPADLAKWLSAHAPALSFIPDGIELGVRRPLDESELVEFYGLAAEICLADRQATQYSLPDPQDLPAGAVLQSTANELGGLSESLKRFDADVVTWDAIERAGTSGVLDLQMELGRAAQRLRSLETPWLSRVRTEVRQGGHWAAEWREHCKAIRVLVDEIVPLRKALAGHSVVLPAAMPPSQLTEQLGALRRCLQEGHEPSWIFQRGLRAFQRACRVDGELPRTARQVDLCIAKATLQRQRHSLLLRWQQQVGVIGGGELDAKPGEPEIEADHRTDLTESAVEWELEGWPTLRRQLVEAGLRVPSLVNAAQLDVIERTLGGVQEHFRSRLLEEQIDQLRSRLTAGQEHPEASPLWAELAGSLAQGDWVAWAELRSEAERLMQLLPAVHRLEELRARLSVCAPQWAARILEFGGDREQCGEPERFGEAWAWRQGETWLGKHVRDGDTAALQRRLEEAQRTTLRLTGELVGARAWQHVAQNLSDSQRQALTAWAQFIAKVGKGKGKFAARWRAEAARAMRQAQGAVPVWILPAYRAVESFDPQMGCFDVVIVDESSQCDILTIGLLGLGRKVVVVGDDKQISPQVVGWDQAKAHELIAKYIPDLPHAQLFDVTASLYDIAKRAFPGVVMLREHFRCVADIIKFSSELSYNGKILPLREDLPDWRPLVDVFLPEGYRDLGNDVNDVEATWIVEKVRELCSDPRYRDRTFGIISLLGDGQAPRIQSLLVDALGEREMERRRVRCGSAYHFQGDERDVVFLSMVVSPGDGRVGAFTKPADQQRINVAASRARDQLWLVRSIEADQLHPEDLRGRLIRHCQSPARPAVVIEDLGKACESEFERDVLRHLLTRGYSVWPQFPVGRMRIDFVVRGERERLAVECDGDAWHGPDRWDDDRRRQEILERLGWKFHRVRGGAFYRDQEEALASLWDRLTSLRIEPGRWGWSDTPESAARDGARTSLGPSSGRVRVEAPIEVRPEGTEPDSTVDDAESGVADGGHDAAARDHTVATGYRPAPGVEEENPKGVGQEPPTDLDPSAAEVGLYEYRHWPPRRLKAVEVATPEEIAAGLEEIIGAEGPMLAIRAYQLYVAASGGKKVGKVIKRALNSVTTHAVRKGKFLQLQDDEPGQMAKTILLPGTAPVVTRRRGPRDLQEVPRTEVAEVVRRVRTLRPAAGPEEVKRITLQLYERKYLTTQARDFLEKCMLLAADPKAPS